MDEIVKKILLLPVTSDFIFKLIFGDSRNLDILASFLMAVLNIPEEEFSHLTVVDPHVKKESVDDKYAVLDVKVHTKSGIVIHVEIQVKSIPDMISRTVYQHSKMITEQMSSGMNWSVIKKTVSIIITDYDLITSDGSDNDSGGEIKKYHNKFRYRTEDGIEYTDLSEINILELSKLPANEDSTELWWWMKFMKTDDGEVLNMIAERSPTMRKAVGVLKELSADERTRMLYEARETARRDEESRLSGAIRDTKNEIASNLISIGMDDAAIVKSTGLTEREIELLKEQILVNQP